MSSGGNRINAGRHKLDEPNGTLPIQIKQSLIDKYGKKELRRLIMDYISDYLDCLNDCFD